MPASAARRSAACVSELPTHSTASYGPPASSSHRRTSAGTSTPRASASARVRDTISGLASEALTANPRSASPTASVPVPQAQSSTRMPGSSNDSNAAALPSGESRASGTRKSYTAASERYIRAPSLR